VESAKPQDATKFLSHAGENVIRKSRKPAQLKAFSYKDYQLITKLISIMDNIFIYSITLLLRLLQCLTADYLVISDSC